MMLARKKELLEQPTIDEEQPTIDAEQPTSDEEQSINEEDEEQQDYESEVDLDKCAEDTYIDIG